METRYHSAYIMSPFSSPFSLNLQSVANTLHWKDDTITNSIVLVNDRKPVMTQLEILNLAIMSHYNISTSTIQVLLSHAPSNDFMPLPFYNVQPPTLSIFPLVVSGCQNNLVYFPSQTISTGCLQQTPHFLV